MNNKKEKDTITMSLYLPKDLKNELVKEAKENSLPLNTYIKLILIGKISR